MLILYKLDERDWLKSYYHDYASIGAIYRDCVYKCLTSKRINKRYEAEYYEYIEKCIFNARYEVNGNNEIVSRFKLLIPRQKQLLGKYAENSNKLISLVTKRLLHYGDSFIYNDPDQCTDYYK